MLESYFQFIIILFSVTEHMQVEFDMLHLQLKINPRISLCKVFKNEPFPKLLVFSAEMFLSLTVPTVNNSNKLY